jgi:lathosterol oxidase
MNELTRIWLMGFGFTSVRYVLIAGGAFLLVYLWMHNRLSSRKIQPAFPSSRDYWREFGYSMLTFCVFGFTGIAVYLLRDVSLMYTDLHSYPLWWLAASVPVALVIHDTYFYWTHRLMHHPRLFKVMHLVHHRSTNPSPWASFAFHPLEAVVESGILIVLVLVIPMHPLAIFLFLLTMTAENAMGHLGYEFFPKWLTRSRIGRWLNTSTNHNMHHRYFEGNYGLYFRWWDIWMGTTHPRYDTVLEEVQRRAGGEHTETVD